MCKSYAILPCNGLDKCAGCISKEIALILTEKTESKIVCPVFFRVVDAGGYKLAQEKPLLVIDGCATHCASRIAAEKDLKVSLKINVSDEAKNRNFKIGDSLRIGEQEAWLAGEIAQSLLLGQEECAQTENALQFPEHIEYARYQKEKYIYRTPKEGFYFNENDCWAYISGKVARIGVGDFVQQSLSDILFVTPPKVGSEVEQFGEAGLLESSKATFEVVSPVSGRIIAVNDAITASPELVNKSPYERGWIADIALRDFESDRELLIGFDEYFKILKRKVDEYRV